MIEESDILFHTPAWPPCNWATGFLGFCIPSADMRGWNAEGADGYGAYMKGMPLNHSRVG
ncbi:hypothetical protein U8326_10940 [Tsuneonella sp. CC-YZS046]|uniref:hypothetical protein n=1 Tax=Tsuneonella sp. CC-YZS046 TaxID=3042152 RepID=UPI002D7A112B|nr:hypothetical protein [Tsuneonella sp. CC-YZS046]WRO65566.1 hypothetical protein U8326_10940 [Tsuneonella sp. CC-YZS046]